MPKRGANNPYKGVPKSQWAAIKAGMAANPNSAQAQERVASANVSVKQSGDGEVLNVPGRIPVGSGNSSSSVLQPMQGEVHAGVAQGSSAERIATLENELSQLRQRVPAPGQASATAMSGVSGSSAEASSGLRQAAVGGMAMSGMSSSASSVGGNEPYAGVSTLTLNAAGADAIPQNLFDGNTPKLLLYSKSGDPKDPVPGYRTYWFNDDGNRLTLAKASGWEHIDRDEVMMGVELGPSNKDLGSKVRYVVGTLRSGDPMYAYAMKLPLYIAEAHAAQREAVNQRVENSLRQGQHVQTGERLIPGGQPGWNAPAISIAAKTYR